MRIGLFGLFLLLLFAICEHFLGDDGDSARKEQLTLIEGRCPPSVAEESIFVLVTSLNDRNIGQLVFDLFEKALCPKRVYIGVVENVDNDIDSALFQYELLTAQKRRPKYTSNIRRSMAPFADAMGPLHAYETGRALYANEAFSMVVHAHTDVVDEWDKRCIVELSKCRAGTDCIITYSPGSFESMPSAPPSIVTLEHIDPDVPEVRLGSLMLKRTPSAPVPALFWTAKFAFGYGNMMRVSVPSSPLKCVPNAQDLVTSIKLWSKGFTFYTPCEELVFHRSPAASLVRKSIFDIEDRTLMRMKERYLTEGSTYLRSFLTTTQEARGFAKFIGCDFQSDYVPRDLKLGITKNDTPNEIALKERVLMLSSE